MRIRRSVRTVNRAFPIGTTALGLATGSNFSPQAITEHRTITRMIRRISARSNGAIRGKFESTPMHSVHENGHFKESTDSKFSHHRAHFASLYLHSGIDSSLLTDYGNI